MTFITKLTKPDEKAGEIIRSRRTAEEIAWVFPDAIKNWETVLNTSKMDQIMVKSTETAVIFEYEQYIQNITNGIYKIDRKKGAEEVKIVFLAGSGFDIKWGIPQQQGSLTSENIKIGSSGTITVSISSPEVFCQNLLKESSILTYKDIRPKVNSTIRA